MDLSSYAGLGLPDLSLGGVSPIKGGGVPAGFALWKTDTQTWRFGTQRAISPART